MESFSATTERIDIGDETENHDDVISPDPISVGLTESSVLMHLFETRTEQEQKRLEDPVQTVEQKNDDLEQENADLKLNVNDLEVERDMNKKSVVLALGVPYSENKPVTSFEVGECNEAKAEEETKD